MQAESHLLATAALVRSISSGTMTSAAAPTDLGAARAARCASFDSTINGGGIRGAVGDAAAIGKARGGVGETARVDSMENCGSTRGAAGNMAAVGKARGGLSETARVDTRVDGDGTRGAVGNIGSEGDGSGATDVARLSFDSCCDTCDAPDEERAALRLQRFWRSMRPRTGGTRIEREWSGARARRLGALPAHVRFLQYVFRRSRELRPGCWRRGGMRGLMCALRLTRSYRCGGGANLATDAEFDEQRERAERVLDWYRQYVQLLRRLMSGTVPSVVDDFCGGGGASEGVRRGGGVAHGIDSEVQAEFIRRFGVESFSQGDGVSWSVVANVLRRARAVGGMASPPCKFYSTARVRGEARAPPLIEQTRDMLAALFEFWVIENVLGARSHLALHAVELRGAWFGRRSRAECWRTGYGVRAGRRHRRGSGCCRLGSRPPLQVALRAWAARRSSLRMAV